MFISAHRFGLWFLICLYFVEQNRIHLLIVSRYRPAGLAVMIPGGYERSADGRYDEERGQMKEMDRSSLPSPGNYASRIAGDRLLGLGWRALAFGSVHRAPGVQHPPMLDKLVASAYNRAAHWFSTPAPRDVLLSQFQRTTTAD